jgi:oligopeptidase A
LCSQPPPLCAPPPPLPTPPARSWCYDRRTLDGFARHYQTGAPLPDDLFARLLAARTYRSGSMTLRQVHFAVTDLELHSNYAPGGAESVFDRERAVEARTLVMPPLPEDRFLCGFSHIFAGGYSAGYYSYKWAEVLSADAFAAFEDAGLEDEAAVAATGRRFAGTVLALGGGRAPGEVFKDFRGREPSTEALLRHNNLLAAA